MQNRRRPRLLILLLTGILFSFAAVAEAQNFTLEQVMSSPFPSDLIVSKRGDKLAWAFDAEGKRNIWIAEGRRSRPGKSPGRLMMMVRN